MPPGDSTLLPDPPPPRPDRREAAIGAALRRFDGVEDAAPAPDRPRPRASWWSGRPQLAMAMSIALVAVIGIPMTWMAVRNGALTSESPRPETSAKASQPITRFEPPAASQDNMGIANAVSAPGEAKEFPAAPPIPAQRRNAPSMAANERALDEAVAAPAPMIAAAPPPPSAIRPPAAEEKMAQGAVANDIAITGARIPQPNLVAKSDSLARQKAAREKSADAQTAPDWVLKDRSYASFLSQLQAAVRSGNRGAVIKLVGYPLRVNSSDKSQVYRNAASIRADYDKIFTPRVRQAILNQKFEQLFGRDQGVMIGDGAVWFDHAGSAQGPVRITAINR